MRRLLALTIVLAVAGQVNAAGLLIPKEKEVPPLAMLSHKVSITIDDQVAITTVEQVFRNHTDRQLEATYTFPVPKGAGVQKFSMWVNGKKMDGELLEAKKARKIYTDIVQRTKDPGLLEYIDHKMLRMRVFPILPRSDQKVSFQYISEVPSDSDTINYTYPLKTDGKAVQTLEKLSITATLKSQHAVQNIYSPTHAITVTRNSDKEAKVTFEKNQGILDRNFQLYYTSGKKDVGVTALTHRPIKNAKGYFMMLISPRAELSKDQHVPRDVVFILDTSGSMRGKRIDQAKKALDYCLSNLHKEDRFAVVQFATTVNKYHQQWLKADEDNVAEAKKWVGRLAATGGTNINQALTTALDMRTKEKGRTFTVVFFTDGRPTVGETDTKRILQSVLKQNTVNTRIFTFGVGNDVNATMLDQMAEQSRAVSSFVRESENIEDKVSTLYNKISHPVLAGLKLNVNGVTPSEVYPPQLPDLFHGGQLVVIGRYDGYGHAVVKLTGSIGDKDREFVYEVNFPKQTKGAKDFVEDLWARRKVGFLLDQIRRNGEQKELVTEVITLAKRYGITTPYTSYLIVPDAPVPVAQAGRRANQSASAGNNKKPDVSFGPHANRPVPPGGKGFGRGGRGGSGGLPAALDPKSFGGGFGGFAGGIRGGGTGPGKSTKNSKKSPTVISTLPPGLPGNGKSGDSKTASPKSGKGGDNGKVATTPTKPLTVAEFVKGVQQKRGEASTARGRINTYQLEENEFKGKDAYADSLRRAQRQLRDFKEAQTLLQKKQLGDVQNGKLGVNLSLDNNLLRNQSQLTNTAIRRVQNRNLLEVGGIWIDEAYEAKLKTVTVKALSKAYFAILAKHPEVKDVFRLGNHLVWVTPSGTALVIDTTTGKTEMTDQEIDALFKK